MRACDSNTLNSPDNDISLLILDNFGVEVYAEHVIPLFEESIDSYTAERILRYVHTEEQYVVFSKNIFINLII